MNYLIYELFSGVGLCNQIFSLETAIYLAAIMNRRLILSIKQPLCHCGKASWDYGYVMNYFTDNFKDFLPHGIEVHYKSVPESIQEKINNEQNAFFDESRFSAIVFVDKELDTPSNQRHINEFCHKRKKVVFSLNDYKQPYLYVGKSNASRCFSNFYTTHENYRLMYGIANSLHFKSLFYEMANTIYSKNIKKNSIFVHLRFGDHHKDVGFLERSNKTMIDSISNFVNAHKTNISTPEVYALIDNKNNEAFLKAMKNYKMIFVDEMTKNVMESLDKNYIHDFQPVKNNLVANAIVDMLLAARADEFIGYNSSTFSAYIQFLRYKWQKSYCYYSNLTYTHVEQCRLLKTNDSNVPWYRVSFQGGHPVSWHHFFPVNIIGDRRLITIHNKTDGFGSQLQACFSLIAYCHFKGYEYIHTPFTRMQHNDNNISNFPSIMNTFINLEKKFRSQSSLTEGEITTLHRRQEGPYVHGTFHPEYFYNETVRNILRDCYYSKPKPDLSSLYTEGAFNVAVHIRRGDVNVTKYPSRFIGNDVYLNHLQKYRFPPNTQIHVFSEGSIEDFEDIQQLYPNARFHLSSEIKTTFHAMVQADLLIISKSSFSYCAGLLNKNRVDGSLIAKWWHKPLKQWEFVIMNTDSY